MLSVEGGAGAERYVQVGVRWRSVESSAGDDGDSPLVEVGLLLPGCQGKVHLQIISCNDCIAIMMMRMIMMLTVKRRLALLEFR